MKSPDVVLVRAAKAGRDGYEGQWYVIERSGNEYGLARSPRHEYAEVWIHKQRVEPVFGGPFPGPCAVCHAEGLDRCFCNHGVIA